MKPRMMSKEAMDTLFFHILDGFKVSHEGIHQLFDKGIINHSERTELLEKNSERLITRIHEFKLGHKLLCIFFAFLFGYMQIIGSDLEMRRTGRTARTGRSMRSGRSSRSGRRDNTDNEIDFPEYV
jgi:hypothetical protein